MSDRRTVLGVLLLAASSLACSDPWLVVKEGNDEGFRGKKSFMFDAVSLADAEIDGVTEEQYIAEGDDLVEFWERGKATFKERFPASLSKQLNQKGIGIGPGPTLHARVEKIIVGELYTVDDNPNYLRTEFTMVVKLVDGDVTSDEVRLTQSAHGFATKPVELRYGAVADHLGRLTADFVAAQVAK